MSDQQRLEEERRVWEARREAARFVPERVWAQRARMDRAGIYVGTVSR